MSSKEEMNEIEEKLEKRIDEGYGNLNEFVNKEEEFTDVVISEFGELCDEEFGGKKAAEFYDKNKCEILKRMINLYQCNF